MARICHMCNEEADVMLPGVNHLNQRFFGAYCATHAKTALRKPKNKERIWYLFPEQVEIEQVTRGLG